MKIADAFEQAVSRAQSIAGQGEVATYIPELARADPGAFAVVVHPVDGEPLTAGDVTSTFTLQSVSKVFSLAVALHEGVEGLFERTSVEPSGDAFHSIVRLEEEQGVPRNPLINAGAIVVSEALAGADPQAKHDSFCAFMRTLCAGRFDMDEAVYASEASHGGRNRALAQYMGHFGVVADPPLAVDAYFRQCSTLCSTTELAAAAQFLAYDGVDPSSGRRVLSPQDNRTVVALMATCGLYDEVGRFAVDVGLPTKSGVSGAMLGVAPGRMTIATYGPALGPKGNSVAGATFLRSFVNDLGLTLYAPHTGDLS